MALFIRARRAFCALFDWKISVAEFPIDALSPRAAAARGRSCGRQATRDRNAGRTRADIRLVQERPGGSADRTGRLHTC